jgi:hypothetical protein
VGLLDHSREELLETVDLAFLWFFATEMLVRLWIGRLGFFCMPWSCFDAAIIVLALLPVLGGGIAVLRMARLARAGHPLRHVTHLRLWRLLRHESSGGAYSLTSRPREVATGHLGRGDGLLMAVPLSWKPEWRRLPRA